MKNRFILSPSFLDEVVPELETLATSDWVINKPSLPGGDKQTRISHINGSIADFVTETIHARKRPVSIAGDCCKAIGVLAGLQRAGVNPFLIWFDAHGDFNTWETTPTGFLGGMPLAMIVGRGEQTITKAVGLRPLPETQVILTDARDLDPGERKLVKESAILHLDHPEHLIVHYLPDMPLYIHFDTDIVNPNEVSAMNYPASGGLSVAELQNIFRYLAQNSQIVAVSMSTWNPKLDKNGQSKKVCMMLFQSLLNLN